MKKSPQTFYGLLAAILIAALAVVLIVWTNLNPFWVWIGAAGLVTFLMYGYDKAQAKRAGPRVPEIVLHGLALAGGFAGGWAGMLLFRHKTRHPAFIIILAASTVLYLALGYLWFWR